ncbi:TIR domain-containing protein [uncultured Thiodictyon sp.]|uniref:SEFIR domain-containing protein n=1 Tax=uncultured Thiodictyon sp. TaxID=1846217 RepID=UPI0025DF9069|nr:TIR domain-containing protein [uncultured Thiodictyon sp.]
MDTAPRVFVSYSHDSDAHRERVLALSERLRGDGIATELDQYVNGAPPEGWPRWMLDGLDASDRVLLICTPTYYRRFRGHEAPGKGKGVDWEGAIVTQAIYDARSRTTRFIPVLFDPGAAGSIPEPVRGHTHYCLTSEAAYRDLYDALLDQAGVEPGELGTLKPKARRRGEPLRLPDPAATADPSPDPVAPPDIDLSHLPAGAPHFLGRESELAALDAAWCDGAGGSGCAHTAIVELVAPGGTGKTALVRHWLAGLAARDWPGAARVYAWSFYSQGTAEDRQATEDHFLAAAVARFAVPVAPSANPADKGQALAETLVRRRTLLLLDGCEPLQYPPGPLAGELRTPGLKSLLGHLASAGRPGLCVLTTREPIRTLDAWVRRRDRPAGTCLRLDLGSLSDADGARLLHALGADRAGSTALGPDDPELCAASRAVRGHALTLSLLGNYLRLAYAGDIRARDRADLGAASAAAGGHAHRAVAAYERWFERSAPGAGESGAQALAALRLLGYFDRPASVENLAALRAAPPIPGLTEALFARPGAAADGSADVPSATARSAVGAFGFAQRIWRSLRHRAPPGGGGPAESRRSQGWEPIGDTQWRIALKRLEEAGLIAPPDPANASPEGTLDAHPLVREYLADAIAARSPDAWREGHRRLYARLAASAPHRPEGLDGLQPLYQAVAHGCRAGLWQEVCDGVYIDRILRGTGHDGAYSVRKLGAFGADLGAVACFFAEPWTRPVPALAEGARGWLLHEAAFRLRALGRLAEALEPMRAGAQMYVEREEWKYAARVYGNLSELLLTLGRVAESAADAERSVGYADRCGDAFWRMASRAALADALHQRGEIGQARLGFAEAETMQAELQPQYQLLYSLQGFRYGDLLLAAAERAAWVFAAGDAGGAGDRASEALADCEAVARRAGQTLEWEEGMPGAPLLDFALHHLTLARAALYADRLQGRPPGPEAQAQTEQAVGGLRAAGAQEFVVCGLLTRAWLRGALGDPAGARTDLAQVQEIASRGAMQLHLADCALHRARLFRDRQALAQARRLIESCHYGRRLPELADAEAAAKDWPP